MPDAPTPDEAAAPCQKCQVYPDGTVYRTRCICPEPMTAEETLRGVAGLGGGIGDAVRDVLAERDALRAELDAARADVERLRGRTHEIQATEMAKRAALDSEVADWRNRWDEAKRWTEEAGITADWSPVRPLPHYWGMTSLAARLALFRLVGERNEARAGLDAARTREQAVRALCEKADRETFETAVFPGFVDTDDVRDALGSATPQEGDNRGC